MSAKEIKIIACCAAGFCILFVVGVGAATRLHSQDSNHQPLSSQPAGDPSTSSAGIPDTSTIDTSTIDTSTIEGIYACLSPGMTEDQLIAKVGKPDTDTPTQRDGTYGEPGSNSEAQALSDAAVPAGRFDAGHTRYLTYKRGGRLVWVILIDTLDNEHPQLTRETFSASPVWVVLEYEMV